MQRQNLDVGSVAALLLQTEASLSALHRPSSLRSDSSCREDVKATPRSPAMEGGPGLARRSGSNNNNFNFNSRPVAAASQLELEEQVVYLNASMNRLEQRLREERGLTEARRLADERRFEGFMGQCEKRLTASEEGVEHVRRSFEEATGKRIQEMEKSIMTVCERRLVAGEDQLKQMGKTIKDFRRCLDEKFQDMDESAQHKLVLEEVRECLRRLQADSQGLEGRLQKCILAEDLDDRLGKVETAVHKRLEDRLKSVANAAEERCGQLEGNVEVVAQRYREIDRRLSERLSCQASLLDSVTEQLPGLREFQSQVHAMICNAESDQRRLEVCESCFVRMPVLETKLDEVQEHVGKQLEEQAQTARSLRELAQRLPPGADGAATEQRLQRQSEEQAKTTLCLRELSQRLPQKLADVEQLCQRVERQASSLEARLHARLDEDGGRVAKELEGLQQHLVQRVDDAEVRLQRTAARLEREGKEHMEWLQQRSAEAEGRLREMEVQADRLVEAGIKQLQDGPCLSPKTVFDAKASSGPWHYAQPQPQPLPSPLQSPQQSQSTPLPSPPQATQIQPLPLGNPNPFSTATSAALPYMRSFDSEDRNSQAASMSPGLYNECTLQPLGMTSGPLRLPQGRISEVDDAECCGLF